MKNISKYIFLMHIPLLMALFLLFVTNFFVISSYEDFYNYIYNNLFPFLGAIVFIIAYLVILVDFIRSKVTFEKIIVLYLDKIIDDVDYFIDKKGKVYHYYSDEYEVGKFYNVLVKDNKIKKILEETSEQFKLKPLKESYWLNYYSPAGNFNDIFLLPIIYVPFIMGVIGVILNEGFSKLYGVLFGIVPLVLIIYDLICKINIRRRKENLNIDLSIVFNKIVDISIKVIRVVVGVFIVGVFYYLYSHSGDEITRKVMLVFFILAVFAALAIIFKDAKNIKIDFEKIYIIVFLSI